jgi:hypothetical protein
MLPELKVALEPYSHDYPDIDSTALLEDSTALLEDIARLFFRYDVVCIRSMLPTARLRHFLKNYI